MNKDKIKIDKNKIPFEVRKNINLSLNSDGFALVDTKWLIKENFVSKEPTMENIMNSDYIYFIDVDNTTVRKIKIKKCIIYKHNFLIEPYNLSKISFSIDDYKKIWAFSPCDLEGVIRLE